LRDEKVKNKIKNTWRSSVMAFWIILAVYKIIFKVAETWKCYVLR